HARASAPAFRGGPPFRGRGGAQGAGRRQQDPLIQSGGSHRQIRHRSRHARPRDRLASLRTPTSRNPCMTAIEVKVPDIGDYKDVPIIEVHVKAGDAVSRDDPLITLESDKAAMEVPAPGDGTIAEVLVRVGDKVSEGAPIVRLTSDAASEDK